MTISPLLLGFIGAIIPSLLAAWVIRRKTKAETEKIKAETADVYIEAASKLIAQMERRITDLEDRLLLSEQREIRLHAEIEQLRQELRHRNT